MPVGDVLDVGLLLVAVAFGSSGFRQGFLVGLAAFAGFLAGAVAGAAAAPPLHRAVAGGVAPVTFGLAVVFACAALGQLLATAVAGAARRRIEWRPARVADAAGGALISVTSVLLVAWLVGTAVAHSTLTAVAGQVQHSAILTGIDDVMPDAARTWFAGFRRLLSGDAFPPVFGALGAPPTVDVPPPDPAVLDSPAVAAARAAVFKVVGLAPSCSRELEGSSFLYAPGRLLTNAHVVAGVTSLRVLDAAGRSYSARVVLYDPRTDVAVLAAPELTGQPLRFAPAGAGTGAPAAVVGYPEDGPLRAVPARVRVRQEARGPDIYSDAEVTRSIYALFAQVLPGNSGGPLLAPNGRVYGVVFAAAVGDPSTGYALTAGQVAADARRGAAARRAVATGACD